MGRWHGFQRVWFLTYHKVGPVSYTLRDVVNHTELRVYKNQIIPFRTNEDFELITPDGAEVPTPSSG